MFRTANTIFLRHWQGLALLFIFLCSPAQAQTSAPGWTPPARPVVAPTPSAARAQRGLEPLSRWLPQIKLANVTAQRLPALSAHEQKQRAGQPLRIGALRSLPAPLTALDDTTAFAASGGTVHLARVASPGAHSLRLHFTQFALPAGARLFVYAAHDPAQFHGPFTGAGPQGDGEFWTASLPGEEIVIEYFAPSVPTAALPFRVVQLSHQFNQQPAPCNEPVAAEWREAAQSVGRLRFIEPDGEYLCTGTLLNTSNNSGKPYVLTANHCISTHSAAASLEVSWLFDSGTTPSGSQQSYGAWLLATSARNDFSLLEIRTLLPQGARFAGWTTQRPAPGTAVTGLHHPQGGAKRSSTGQTINTASCPAEIPAARCAEFLKVQWERGITEPGSSGSGLWVGSGSAARLAGTLTGGFSDCNNRTGTDYYGSFDLAFEAIGFYLTGAGTAYSLSETERVVGPLASTGSTALTLREGEARAWTATSDSPWLRVTQGASGAGEATVTYAVDANPSNTRRIGSLFIAGHSLTIFQLGANENCPAASLTPGQTVNGSLSVGDCPSVLDTDVLADRYTFSGTLGQGVILNARSASIDPFLTLYGPQGELLTFNDDSGGGTDAQIGFTGSNFVLPASGVYTVEVTSAVGRATGNYALALTFDCKITVTPTAIRIGAEGGDAQFTATEASGRTCAYTVTSFSSWIPIPVARSFNTTGRDSVLVPFHSGAARRKGTILAAGHAITITQEPPCNYAITPAQLNVSAQGGSTVIEVRRQAGELCFFSAFDNNTGWAQVGNVERQTDGAGRVTILVTENLNLRPRSATLTIAGQPFTITQAAAAACQTSGTLNIGSTVNGALTASDCVRRLSELAIYTDAYRFTARRGQALRVALTSFDLEVGYRIFAPDGVLIESQNNLPADGEYLIEVGARFYSRALGSYTLSVTENTQPSCVQRIGSQPQNLKAEGGAGTFTIGYFAGTNCQWTARSLAPWLTVNTPSGVNGGEVRFTLAPNTGGARFGLILAADEHYVVGQEGGRAPVTVSAADYSSSLAPAGIAAVFGAALANRIIRAETQPLPEQMFGTIVTVRDSAGVARPAPLFFISPEQVNFQLPPDSAPGNATITISNNYNLLSTGSLRLERVAPSVFTANANGLGVAAAVALRVKPGNVQSFETVAVFDAAQGRFVARPLDLSIASDQMFLLLFGTGLRGRTALTNVRATIGSVAVDPTFAGAQGTLTGLDQVNLPLPRSLAGRGEVDVVLTVEGKPANTVRIAIR